MIRNNCGQHEKYNPIQKLKRFFIPEIPPPAQSAELSLENNQGLRGQDIVTLSTQDWRDLWTRKQRFMLQFARQGNKVLYMETQFHWLTYVRRIKQQWRRIYLFLLGPREAEPNLYIVTPPIIFPAFQIYPSIAKLNNFILAIYLRSAMKKIGIKEPLLWLYTHFNEPLIKGLGAKRALYECVDEFSGAKGLVNARVAGDLELATLRAVDAAIVTAPGLKKSKMEINSNIHVVPNAANVAHFERAASGNLPEPNDLKRIPRPRLVFVGAIAYWIDLELLRYVARQRPNWQVVMVGPIHVNISGLDGLPNIHFVGRKPYEILPNYLAWCDIALNPYKLDSISENCSPLKIYEYMAAGMPTVSTDMPEARQFPGLIGVAKNYDDFIHEAEKILNRTDEAQRSSSISCRTEARKHSWEMRFLEVERITEGVL